MKVRSFPTRVSAALVLACLLAGCGANSGDPFDTSGEDGTVQVEDRPPMETVLARYRAFQADLLAQLDKQFGERHWYALDELSFGVCGDADVKDGQIAYLPTMGLRGTYPPEDWQQVRELVIAVGKKHGFSHVTSLVDRQENVYFAGHDLKYGGKYDFGMENNSVFGIETGCLLWGATPHPRP